MLDQLNPLILLGENEDTPIRPVYVERVFKVPPLRLQKKFGLRAGYLFYVQQGDSSIEGCAPTLRGAILDMRAEKHRLRTRTWKRESKFPSWR